jgi:hypothetical protein
MMPLWRPARSAVDPSVDGDELQRDNCGLGILGCPISVPATAGQDLEVLVMTNHTDPYPERVLALEAEGMTTSDAQAVADAELMGAKSMRRKARRSTVAAPKKRGPRECSCGCGEMTKGGAYRPGHDARHHAALKAAGKKPKLIGAKRGPRAVG